MQILKRFFEVFLPRCCMVCKRILSEKESYLCLHCFDELPYTHYPLDNKNSVANIFWGRVSTRAATSLFFYDKQSRIQQILHHLKYKRQPKLGIFAAKLLVQKIKNNPQNLKIAAVVPVPIHFLKKQKRGYHQLAYFGKTLAKQLEVPYYSDVLKVKHFRFSQTTKNLSKRFANVSKKYALNPKCKLSVFSKNTCILLIDDVLTTGATLQFCVKALEEIPVDIAIATIAYVHNECL